METMITIQNEKEMRIIYAKDLLAVKVEDYICTFYFEDEKPFHCTKSLKETISLLPDFFIQINRNCIININKVKFIDLKNKKIQMQSDKTFQVSVRKSQLLKKQLRQQDKK
jgi:DNA-binding LytR/AlgR family response regulator